MSRKHDTNAVRALAYEVRDMMVAGNALAATGLVNKQPADVRAAVRRYLSFFSGPNYPRVGIAESTCRLMGDLLNGSETRSAAQVQLSSDKFLGIQGHAIGAPVLISGRGFSLAPLELHAMEQEAIQGAAKEADELNRSANAMNLFQMIKRKAAAKKVPA